MTLLCPFQVWSALGCRMNLLLIILKTFFTLESQPLSLGWKSLPLTYCSFSRWASAARSAVIPNKPQTQLTAAMLLDENPGVIQERDRKTTPVTLSRKVVSKQNPQYFDLPFLQRRVMRRSSRLFFIKHRGKEKKPTPNQTPTKETKALFHMQYRVCFK